ncbi:MAG: hypothetical protein Q7T03_00900 [Deltaproteobacteria bacterium]|nr:hypothetical protein [Deltaproteobacteria bacterium]
MLAGGHPTDEVLAAKVAYKDYVAVASRRPTTTPTPVVKPVAAQGNPEEAKKSADDLKKLVAGVRTPSDCKWVNIGTGTTAYQQNTCTGVRKDFR